MTTQNATILSANQLKLIDFVALGQRDQDGLKMTMEDFARSLNVNRRTLYNWQESIPDFWELVKEKIDSQLVKYVPDVMLAMREKALNGDVAAAKLFLNQASALRGNPKTELGLEYSGGPVHVEIVNYAGASQ